MGARSQGRLGHDHGARHRAGESSGNHLSARRRRSGFDDRSRTLNRCVESREARAMSRFSTAHAASRERGHAMLELAVSSAVMISCLAGTFQFGYTFYVYNQLVTAIGNGGRYAAMRTYRAATPEDVEKGKTAIRNMVVFGDAQPVPGATPVVAHFSPDQVDVDWTMDESGAPAWVAVSIREFTVDAAFQKFTFRGRPGVEFPFVGKFAPAEHEP